MFRNLMFSLLIGLSFSPAVLAQVNPCADIAKSTEGKSATATEIILESCRGEASALPTITKETASEWASASKDFAHAIGIAAKELGIAVNDFLDSPAGILLAVVLVFNYMGGTILGVVVGIPMLLGGTWMWLRALHLMSRYDVTYVQVPYLWGAFNIRRVASFKSTWSDGTYFLACTSFIAIFGIIAIFLGILTDI